MTITPSSATASHMGTENTGAHKSRLVTDADAVETRSGRRYDAVVDDPVPAVSRETPLASLLLTVTEAAALLRIGRSKTYELIAEGHIEIVHIGRSVRVPRSAVDAFVSHLRKSGDRYDPAHFPSLPVGLEERSER